MSSNTGHKKVSSTEAKSQCPGNMLLPRVALKGNKDLNSVRLQFNELPHEYSRTALCNLKYMVIFNITRGTLQDIAPAIKISME